MLPVPCYTPQLDARSDQKTSIFLLLQLCVITFTIGGIDRRGGGSKRLLEPEKVQRGTEKGEEAEGKFRRDGHKEGW